MTIQRWALLTWNAPTGDGDEYGHRVMGRYTEGDWVFYPHHLAAMKRAEIEAKIAVLEELIAHMRQRYTSPKNPTGSYCNEESCWIADKIHVLKRGIAK